MTGAVLAVDAPSYEFRRLVLKVYRPDLSEPDSAGREARILELVAPTDLPAPRVVAMDREGTDSRWPALLMTRIPGRRRFRPRDLKPWLDGLARLMARIHSSDVPLDSLPAYRLWGADDPLTMPAWWTRPPVWKKAVEVFRGPAPDEPATFIHRDFHPGNVLWKGRRPSAIVDWLHGCRGPAAVDVAHCRINLWRDNGRAAADAWLEAVGAPHHHPYWDIADAMSWIPDPAVEGMRLARRYESFIVDAVSRLG
jgi:Ser/Thr protein kinase RdoA (MazF antagonist)